MNNTLQLALRGLARNRRRSLVTLLAVALGYAAVTLFAGYTHNVFTGLTRQSIHGEMLGHLTLMKQGMRQQGKLFPERYLLTADEVDRLTQLVEQEAHVVMVTPRLALSGLISNGRASTIFIGEGMEPAAMARFQDSILSDDERHSPLLRNAQNAAGKHLDAAHPEVADVSTGLLDILHLTVGGQAAVLVNTLGGQANALDITVGHSFNTGNAGSNDKFIYVPLALARSLLDGEGRADRLTILLDDDTHTMAMRQRLLDKAQAAGYTVEVLTWQELSDFYRQVHGMFEMIFGFIFLIVLTVVVMSVANSMGMTVIERTREIGTLRAIGLKRRGVIRLFAVESMLLAVLGCLAGLTLTLLVRWAVNASGIAYTPPNSANPVPLLIGLDTARIVSTFILMGVIGTLAAWLPARRAARTAIIDALGHV